MPCMLDGILDMHQRHLANCMRRPYSHTTSTTTIASVIEPPSGTAIIYPLGPSQLLFVLLATDLWLFLQPQLHGPHTGDWAGFNFELTQAEAARYSVLRSEVPR